MVDERLRPAVERVPLDVIVEQLCDRREIAVDERAIAADDDLDRLQAHPLERTAESRCAGYCCEKDCAYSVSLARIDSRRFSSTPSFDSSERMLSRTRAC